MNISVKPLTPDWIIFFLIFVFWLFYNCCWCFGVLFLTFILEFLCFTNPDRQLKITHKYDSHRVNHIFSIYPHLNKQNQKQTIKTLKNVYRLSYMLFFFNYYNGTLGKINSKISRYVIFCKPHMHYNCLTLQICCPPVNTVYRLFIQCK